MSWGTGNIIEASKKTKCGWPHSVINPVSTLFDTNNETKRVLFPTLKKLAIEWSQYSKWLILSGLHIILSTPFDSNNETKRVLFPMLKMVDIEWSSFTSKYSF